MVDQSSDYNLSLYPYSNPKVADDWIAMIEGDRGKVRDRDIYPLLKAWIDRIAPTEVLELGCGQGICSEKIDRPGLMYTGVDPSLPMISRAREKYGSPARQFLVGEGQRLELPTERYDVVFSISVILLIEDLRTLFGELSRVLKRGGHFLIVTANPTTYPLWISGYQDIRRAGKRLEGIAKLGDHSTYREVLYLHTLEDITVALASADLEILQAEALRPVEAAAEGMYLAISGFKAD